MTRDELTQALSEFPRGYSFQGDPFGRDEAFLVRTPRRYRCNGEPVYVTISVTPRGGLYASDGGNSVDTIWQKGIGLVESEIRYFAGRLGLGVLPERLDDGSWALVTGRSWPDDDAPLSLVSRVEEASVVFVLDALSDHEEAQRNARLVEKDKQAAAI